MSDPDGIENADSVSDQIRNPPPAPPPLPSVTVAAQVHSGANDDDDNKESTTTGKRGVGSKSYPDDSSSSDGESDEEGANLAWQVPPHCPQNVATGMSAAANDLHRLRINLKLISTYRESGVLSETIAFLERLLGKVDDLDERINNVFGLLAKAVATAKGDAPDYIEEASRTMIRFQAILRTLECRLHRNRSYVFAEMDQDRVRKEEESSTFRQSSAQSKSPQRNVDLQRDAAPSSLPADKLELSRNSNTVGGSKSWADQVDEEELSGSHFNKLEFKLPRLEISKFGGRDHENYLEWRDLILQALEQSKSSDAAKLTFLKSRLEGHALSTVSHLEPGPAGYSKSWLILDARFGSFRVRAEKVMRDFITLKANSNLSMRELGDRMRKAENDFNKLGVTCSDCPVFAVLAQTVANMCLGHQQKVLFERENQKISQSLKKEDQNIQNFFNFERLLDFLDLQANASEVAGLSNEKSRRRKSSRTEKSKQSNQVLTTVQTVGDSSNLVVDGKNKSGSGGGKNKNANANNPTNKVKKGKGNKKNLPPWQCPFCDTNNAHSPFKCPKLPSLTVSERARKVAQKGHCKRCIRKHDAAATTSCAIYCAICSGPHSFLLHHN